MSDTEQIPGRTAGAKLRTLRERRGYSMRELATRADVSSSAVMAHESGRSRGTRVRRRILSALHATDAEIAEIQLAEVTRG